MPIKNKKDRPVRKKAPRPADAAQHTEKPEEEYSFERPPQAAKAPVPAPGQRFSPAAAVAAVRAWWKRLMWKLKIALWITQLLLLIFLADVGRYMFIPDITLYQNLNPARSAFMEYREKQYADAGGKVHIQMKFVPLERISVHIRRAVIASEDSRFWEHEGFDIDAIRAAIDKDWKARRFVYGASTLSQQLAKNLFLSPSKNPTRKLKEAILTYRMERTLTKERILELYLNYAEWGEGIFGVEAAAKHYFGTSALRLTPMQAARLAAILPNPIIFDPHDKTGRVAKRARRLYYYLQ